MIKNIGIKSKNIKSVKWYHFDDSKLDNETLKRYLTALKDVSEFLEPNRSPLASETLHFDVKDNIVTVTDLKHIDVENPSYARGKRIGVMDLTEKVTLPPPEKYNIYITRRMTTVERMTSLIETDGGAIAIGHSSYHPLLDGTRYKNERELRHKFHGAEYLRFPIKFLPDGHIAPVDDNNSAQAYVFFSKNRFRMDNHMMKTARRRVIDEKIKERFYDLVRKINAYIDNDVFCCTIVVTGQEEIQADVIDNIVATDMDELKEAIIGRTKIFEDEVLNTINGLQQQLNDIK